MEENEVGMVRPAPYPEFYLGGGNPEKIFLIYQNHLEVSENK